MHYEPIPISDDEFHDRMERLRFEHRKWDLFVAGKSTVPKGALVLSRREHAQVVAAAEALAREGLRAREALQEDPAAAVALGVPPPVAQAAADEVRGRPIITRMDFFQTAQGWKVAESNDDCPGGYNEAIGLPQVLGDAIVGARVVGDVSEALTTLVRPAERLGIVYATGYAEDLQVADYLADVFRAAGISVVSASPANANLQAPVGARTARRPKRTVDRHDPADGAHLFDEPVDAILRFYPAEWLPGLPNWGAWQHLCASEVPLYNPISAALSQTKAISCWMHDHSSASVRDVVPQTWMLDDETATTALADPHRFVLKPAFGRMGEGVVMGHTCPEDQWRKRVKGAHRNRKGTPYVLQERFQPVTVDVEGRGMTACLGVYVVNGTFAGYYSRVAQGVVAYDAANLLTVVEAA